MADTRRRRATADVDVVVGRAAEPTPYASDLDLYDVFRNVQATMQANTPRPADPVADDSTLSAIRRGIAAHAAAQNTPAANARRARAQEARATSEAQRETPISNMAIGHNAADAVTLGFADELYGAGAAVRDAVANPDTDLETAYRANRDRFRMDLSDASARYPTQASLGAITGNVAGMALPLPGALGRLGQGATWARRAAGAATLGAMYGGLSGLGHSETELSTDVDMGDVAQAASDAAIPAAKGAVAGGAMSAGIDAARGLAAIRRAAVDRARINAALGDRAQRIIESGEIPDLAGRAADEIDLFNAARDDIGDEIVAAAQRERGVSQPVQTSIRDEVTGILRENPDINRLRAAGIVGKPAMRRVALMEGGIEGVASDLDLMGVTQRGEVMRTSEGARRAEEIGRIAHRQRNAVLAAADEAGVRVNGQDIADDIRRRMEPLRSMPSARARAQLEDMERSAQVFEGRILQDGIRVPDDLPVIAPTYTQAELDQIAQHYGRLGRHQNTSELPALEVANARDVRRAIVTARENALNAWDPAQARRFENAQRASHELLEIVPARGMSELDARAANRSTSMSDMQAGIAGASTGAAAGGSVAGPVGAVAGGGLGFVGGAAGNRLWRDFEPSVMATLAEGPILQARLQELGLAQAAQTPSGLRFLAGQLQLRGPRVVGSDFGTPDRPGVLASQAQAQGETQPQPSGLDNPDVRAALGLPESGELPIDVQPADPAEPDDLPEGSENITDPVIRAALGLPPLE